VRKEPHLSSSCVHQLNESIAKVNCSQVNADERTQANASMSVSTKSIYGHRMGERGGRITGESGTTTFRTVTGMRETATAAGETSVSVSLLTVK
jgi:hypothetical protein